MTRVGNKYGAVKTERNGLKFDSRAEATRWDELVLLERAGVITNLRRQVRFPLHVNGELVCTYVADYVYVDENLDTIVEDKKGHRTQVYILKRKLMKAVHGIEIRET